MVLNKLQTKRGFSLVEVIVVSALMLVVFGGLLISFRYSLELISHSRAKLTALTLANDGMEYIRSLSYNAVGTVSGIPSGLIPQVSTTSLNGITFTKRVLVEYIDDDGDGLGAADSNGITTDYKQAKVTLEWTLRGVTKEVFLVSNIIPKSIETDVDGGTVRVNVFNNSTIPLPGADVRLINKTLVPNIDITRSADATGVALFGGAPKGGNYEVIVTAPGYSTDQTYQSTTTLPNPNLLPIAVVESSVSTISMFIDALSNVAVSALMTKIENQFTENFSASTSIATSTNTTVTGGKLQLRGALGTYSLSGTAYLTQITPTPLVVWDYLLLEGTKSNNTNVIVRLYTGTSTPYTLLPDSVLMGNSAGFPLGAINLTALDAGLYPAVTVGVTLTSSNVNETPQVDTLTLGYIESTTPLDNRPLTFTGNKNIGTRADTSVVYKTVISTTTNSFGKLMLNAIEADNYNVVSSGYDIAAVCLPDGLTVVPGVSSKLELLFSVNTAHTLRVVVKNVGGIPVIGAQVTLTRPSFSATATIKSCGQAFFDGLASATDYTLNIAATGYVTQTITNLNISGDGVQTITL